MSDILTKDEREVVAKIKKEHHVVSDFYARSEGQPFPTKDHEDVGKLLTIIDNLSKRGVKKYSQRELHLAFQKQIDHSDWIAKDGRVGKQYDEWLKCARFLGVLEEK